MNLTTSVDNTLLQVLHAANIGIWELSAASFCFTFCEQGGRLLEIPAGEISLPAVLNLVDAQDREEVAATLKKALTDSSVSEINLTFRTTAEKTAPVWLCLLGKKAPDASGETVFRGILTDESERKAQAKHNYKLELLVQRSNDFIGVAKEDGEVYFLNPAALRMVGLTNLKQVEGLWVKDFFMPTCQQKLEQEVFPAVNKHSFWVGELEFRHFVTGKPIPVTYQIFTVNDPDTGKVTGYATASHNLTEYKQAEEKYRFVTDAMPQLVWTTDEHGFHDFFNQQWVDFTGYTVADSLGTDMWNNLLHPDDQARAQQIWQHALSTGEPYEIEYRFKRASDGMWHWFLARALPMRDEQGRIFKWFGTCTDITEIYSIREQLKTSYTDLEAKILFRTLELEKEVRLLKEKLANV